MDTVKDFWMLNNGVRIPCVGFGTWQTPDGETAVQAVKSALEAGYVHIDTAAAYDNEASVGRGIREAGVKREDLFVTSKLWNANRGYDKTMAAFEKTMKDLGLDYVARERDRGSVVAEQLENWEGVKLSAWRGFEQLYKE